MFLDLALKFATPGSKLEEMDHPVKRARIDHPQSSSQFRGIQGFEEFRLTDMSNAEVFYIPSFIDKATSAEWYDELLTLESWYQPQLKVYGKTVLQSRKIAAYATDRKLTMKYSGQVVDLHYDYPLLLRQIQDEVEEKLGVSFNHVMLNLYEDGGVYIGNHRDDVANKVIASVSLGAPRTFIMTHDIMSSKSANLRAKKKSMPHSSTTTSTKSRAQTPATGAMQRKRWTLDPGSLVVMQGDTQRYWKHEIPKEPKIKEGRISLTFRQLAI